MYTNSKNPTREQQLEAIRARAEVLAEAVDELEIEYTRLMLQPVDPQRSIVPTGHITDRAKELLKAEGHASPFFSLPNGDMQLRYDQLGVKVEPGHVSVSFFKDHVELSVLDIPVEGESANILLRGVVGYHGVSVTE